jgi:hypothetical protein
MPRELMALELMPIVGGYYAYKHLVPSDELLKLQLAWIARQEARNDREQEALDT